jgi:hypothetical protein
LAKISGKDFWMSWKATSGVKSRASLPAYVSRRDFIRLSSTALARIFASTTIISAGLILLLAAHLLGLRDNFFFVNVS